MSAEQSSVLAVDVRRSYRDFRLDVRVDVELDGVTGLFGPSGSGKSTLLRLIAGLERADDGCVRFAGETWLGEETFVPPHRRPVGYVFQDARLFTHLDVAGNLRFAARRAPGNGAGPRLDEVVAACDLAPLMQRAVGALSGGERQRVALARTLLCAPRIMLFDEPLASLDAARKHDILPYLESLQARFGIPAIYVSHSMDEIVRLADRVIVLADGQVQSRGATVPVLDALALPSARSRYDIASLLEARIVGERPELHLTELDCHGQPIFVPGRPRGVPGDSQRLQVYASDVVLATSAPRDLSVRNVLGGTVERIEEERGGAFALVTVAVAGGVLRAQLTRQAVRALGLVTGQPVFALLKTAAFDQRVPAGSPD